MILGAFASVSLQAQLFTILPGGDFEPPAWPGTVAGFTLHGNASITADNPVSGTQSLQLTLGSVTPGVSITFPTVVGVQYSLHWDYSGEPAPSASLFIESDVSLQSEFSPLGMVVAYGPSTGTSTDLTWIATRPTSTVNILLHRGTAKIDNISIVPEPAAFAAFFGCGLMALAAIHRRRRIARLHEIE